MKKQEATVYKIETLEERLKRFEKKIQEQDRKSYEEINRIASFVRLLQEK